MTVRHLTLVHARAGQADALGRCLQDLLAPTLRLPGCVRFEIARLAEDPQCWRIEGSWRSATDLQAYFADPLLARVFDRALAEGCLDRLDCRGPF
ncbi:putative quinol monooxygenase [Zestomonas carbonaria]|uniref:ABM domain-containing protein n=1 Tax=Zestomonas carbonaria TaxID=2762745 RepID=A0A7U7IAR6_9GAMM|nr:antibiotic biosynthesis monooxygenase [Pseudomonas carbonaria]CAD5108192.1 hypothetical protein PSEWESI4_02477 [Pseudomonas carbonaria]